MDYHSVVLDIRKMKRQDNVTVGITFSESHCNVLRYKCILSLQGKTISIFHVSLHAQYVHSYIFFLKTFIYHKGRIIILTLILSFFHSPYKSHSVLFYTRYTCSKLYPYSKCQLLILIDTRVSTRICRT